MAHAYRSMRVAQPICRLGCRVVTEDSRLVTIEVESRLISDSVKFIPAFDACTTGVCTHYVDDLLPHASLQVCSYWGYGQVFPVIWKANLQWGANQSQGEAKATLPPPSE
jgi:hypothetical protein